MKYCDNCGRPYSWLKDKKNPEKYLCIVCFEEKYIYNRMVFLWEV